MAFMKLFSQPQNRRLHSISKRRPSAAQGVVADAAGTAAAHAHKAADYFLEQGKPEALDAAA